MPNFIRIHPLGAWLFHADGRPCRNTDTTKLRAAVCNFVDPIIIVYSEIHWKAHKYTLWAESGIFERKPGGTYRNRWAKG